MVFGGLKSALGLQAYPGNPNYTIANLKAELRKCRLLLCSRCHRKHTNNQRGRPAPNSMESILNAPNRNLEAIAGILL
jgi:hypothetical protein